MLSSREVNLQCLISSVVFADHCYSSCACTRNGFFTFQFRHLLALRLLLTSSFQETAFKRLFPW